MTTPAEIAEGLSEARKEVIAAFMDDLARDGIAIRRDGKRIDPENFYISPKEPTNDR